MTPKHSIRQHIINQFGLPAVKTETVIGELGSGEPDKNGVEIFENDIVRVPEGTFPVYFTCGDFNVGGGKSLWEYKTEDIEVIGYAKENGHD